MKTKLLILISLFLTQHLMAQEFNREIDPKTKKVLLRGELSFKDLLWESNCKWLKEGESIYKPNENALEPIQKLAKDYHFVVFLGTWCDDTHNLLPKFYKVVNEALIDPNAIQLFAVNRRKEALNNEHVVFKIERVPTFIVFHQNREVGRITESVNASIEDDLLLIMQNDAKKLAEKNEKESRYYMETMLSSETKD
jgi:thiol-disulfide isomerase/thioredoxin